MQQQLQADAASETDIRDGSTVRKVMRPSLAQQPSLGWQGPCVGNAAVHPLPEGVVGSNRILVDPQPAVHGPAPHFEAVDVGASTSASV